MINKILIIFFLTFSIYSGNVIAQENVKSAQDNQLEQKAYALFKEENYSEALPLFSQLLSLFPKEPNYNYGYSVCLIETNQQIEKSIKYLNFADSKSQNPLIKYYLGRAYHLSYKFDEALVQYDLYAQKATPADKKKYLLDSRIAMCNNGKKLIQYISDLTVVDNKKIKSENYFYSYELNDYGGKLIIKPPEFKSKIDKKLEPANTVVFLPNSGTEAYFGSYGDNKANGKEIYKISKLPDGKWGKAENLGTIINTPYDEDFPFFSTDGRTLYFSSKGHNSMGGYDIFKSEYDGVTKKWTEPINLDFPINTPYDDYLFIPDKEEKYAFFASNRETNGDNISVYKILVDKEPVKREFDNIEDVINTSKLEISTLAQIHKAENSNNTTENNVIKTNNVQNNNTLSVNNYKFKPITYSQNVTTQQISTEVAKDEEIVNEQAVKMRKESNLVYLTANEQNKLANEKRQLASNKTELLKNITDNSQVEQKKQEIFDLITDAENIEQNAVTSYNLAKNLEQVATDIEKDALKTKNIREAINNAGNTNNENLVEVINQNKELLNKSQNKYTTLENEINERNNLAYNKQVELLQNEKTYSDNQNNIKETENEINTLKQQYNENYLTEQKNELNNKIESKNQQLIEYQTKESVLEENYEKTKTENENLQAEVSFLKQTLNSVNNDKRSSQDIAMLSKNINKEQLHKEIFTKELGIDIKNTNTTAKNNNLTVSNNAQLNEEEVKKLYIQAESNNKIADSLQVVISEKEKTMATITDANKHAAAFNEIVQLNDIKDLKRKQSNELLKQAKTNDKTLASKNNTNAYNSNSVFPFSNENQTNQDSKIVAYQKELLNAQYYDNLIREQQSKFEILNGSLNNTTDANSKSSIEKQITDLNKTIAQNKKIKEQSNFNASKLHADAVSEIDTSLITNEQLVLNATQYQLKSNLTQNNDQVQIMKLVEDDRKILKDNLQQYNKITAEISDLTRKNESSDVQTKKQIEKQIITKREKQKELINNYLTISKESNQDANSIYKDVIEENRIIDNKNPDLRLANMLDKEAEIYFEKASNVRKDANMLNKPEEIQKEYQKADNIEQIAIQKQKYAIDLFVKSKTNLTASNDTSNNYVISNQIVIKRFNAVSPDTNTVPSTIQITLNPDEENQLKTYSQETHKADVMLNEANKNLAEVEDKRKQAANIFSSSEKQKILKGVDVQEQKAIEESITAYNNLGKADSLKYVVYKNQIIQLQNSAQNIGNNKSIAKQYASEAEFYFNEANNIRQKAKNTSDKTQKNEELKRATDFEKKALSSQDFAVDVLTDVNPVFFVSTNDLTKVDRLDVLNQPVDVDDIVHIKTSRIISKLNLKEDELKRFDEVEKKRVISNQLINDAAQYKKTIDSLQKIVDMPPNEKEKKRAQKQIPKLEKNMFASQFTSAEIDEGVNDARFYLYKDNFQKTRLNDNTNEARQGKQLEKNANTKYSKAKSLREKAFMKEDAHIAFEMVVQAKQLEIEAIEDQEKAYGIYFNLKPLEDELKEYALTHPNKIKQQEQNLVVKSTADITHIETKVDTTQKIIASNQTTNQQPTNNKQQTINNQTTNNNIENNTENNKQQIANNAILPNISTTQVFCYRQIIRETDGITVHLLVNNANLSEDKQHGKVQEKIPLGYTATNIDSKNGAFSFKDNNVKFIWTTLPDESQYQISYKLTATTPSSEIPDISGAFFYIDNEGTKIKTIENHDFLDNNLLVNNQIADKQIADKQIADKQIADKQIADKQIADKQIADKQIADKQIADKQIADKQIADKQIADKQIADKQIADKQIADKQVIASNLITNKQTTNNSNFIEALNKQGFGFSILPVNAYSNASPIPMNIPLPDGIVFKVQIGAFNAPIKNESFKGLNPVTGETLEGSKYVRYYVGLFYSEDAASIVRDQIKPIGYSDAFIVAYKDGKKIPLYEARRLLKEAGNTENYKQLAQAEVDKIKNRATNTTYNNTEIQNKNKVTNINTANNQNVNSTNVTNTTDLFYTVQIGVYKNAVTAQDLKNLSPIYEEHAYGFIRYTTGKYNDFKKADIEKNRIIQLGITDAFVSAYYNGKRLSVADALKIGIQNKGTNSEQIEVKYPEQQINNNQSINIIKDSVIFKVQIGSFKEQVPVAKVARYLEIAANYGLNQDKDENGIIIYSIGKFKSYDEAIKMRDVVINNGEKDAFVVAYSGKQKISVNDAKKTLNQ